MSYDLRYQHLVKQDRLIRQGQCNLDDVEEGLRRCVENCSQRCDLKRICEVSVLIRKKDKEQKETCA